jgi:RimJ/RimL family protein N-acetyltransferase
MYLAITTDRLHIEPISLDDAQFILELLNTEGWLNFIGDRNVKNEMDAKDYIQKLIDSTNRFYNVIRLKDTHQPIGVVTYINRDNQKYPDIGFALLPSFDKKGYAYEASRKFLDEIIKTGIHEKILGITMPSNSSSIKLLEKLGLTFQEKFIENNEELAIYSVSLGG